MLDQQNGESFRPDIAAFKVCRSKDGFRALLCPTGNVFANVIEHAQFRIAATKQLLIQVLRGRFVAR